MIRTDADPESGRHLRATPALDIAPLPAPWPYFPHCPTCHRRPASANPGARLPPCDGLTCPRCGADLLDLDEVRR